MSGAKKKKLEKEEMAHNNEQVIQKKRMSPISKIFLSIIFVIVAALAIYLYLFNSESFRKNATALSIGPEKISVAEYNYNYYSAIHSFTANLSNYGMTAESVGLDLSKPLSAQTSPYGQNGETWENYFRKQTNDSLKQIAELYLAAKANGTKLPDDTKKSIDDSINGLKDYCKSQGISVDSYLAKNFGEGVDEAVLRKTLERSYLADYYSSEKKKSFSFTNDDAQKYYNEHKADFDLVDYRSFVFDGSNSSNATDSTKSTQVDKKTLAELKAKADKMLASITDEASFAKLALENAPADKKNTYKNTDVTLIKGATSSKVGDTMKGWLYDDARKTGDKTVISSETSYTVVYFIKRYRTTDPTVNVRHILIQPETSSGSSTATAAQKAAAKASAQKIYDGWKKGPKTEESFAKLATEKSSDTGSIANGGLYENVYPGQMVTEFNNWIFDKARKPGDTGIVETSYGYHIMYFIGKGEDYWIAQVKDTLVTNAYDDFMKQLEKKYKYKEHSVGLSFTGKLG